MQTSSTQAPNSIQLACQALTRGELVIYPTETCYGLAADATSSSAVSRLLEYKGDRNRQVSIAVANQQMARQYVSLNQMAANLYRQFLPGPITVISSSLHHADPRLESAEGTLGIRIPNYPYTLALINQFGKPITATSANTSGRKEPYSLDDWQKYTSTTSHQLVSLFLDAGPLGQRPTSTVVDTTLNDSVVLRQGELILPAFSPTLTTSSSAATQQVAAKLTRQHLSLLTKYPLILALVGELGAGKTQFAKGVASALGVGAVLTSPTYTLLKEYPYSLTKYSGTLYHLDTWRLSDMTELESTLHLSTLLQPGNVVVLEWAGKAKSYLDQYKNDYPILLIDIKENNASTRLITYSLSTPEWS